MNMNNFDKLYNLDNLYNAYVKAKQGTDWKESVQRYEANLLLNLLSVRKEIVSGKYKPKPMVEFTLCERGHTRRLNYSLLTLMAFEEGDSHFKENSLLP